MGKSKRMGICMRKLARHKFLVMDMLDKQCMCMLNLLLEYCTNKLVQLCIGSRMMVLQPNYEVLKYRMLLDLVCTHSIRSQKILHIRKS
jgi:hypothetical protein